jgi:hypothetical protein
MLRTRTVFAGLIAFLVIGNTGAESKRHTRHTQQPIQAPSANPTQPPEPDQRGTDQIPLTVKELPSEDAKERAEKEERERTEKAGIDKKLADETERLADETQALSRYTGGLAIFTLFLFFAATGQIALFWIQLRLIRESLTDAKVAANAAKQSADVARDALVLSGETAKRQLRAYLSIELAIRDGEHQLAREFKAKITFKNCGQTPAYEGIMRISIDACAVSPASIEPASKRATFMFEMPPGNIFTATPEIDSNKLGLYDETISSFNDGKIAIYILGKADFKDAFGEDRWFKFRLRYDKGCVATGHLNVEDIKSN